MSATEYTTYEWVYAHRVFLTDNKIGSKWFDHNGEERHFTSVPRLASPGTRWDVETTDNAGKAAIMTAKYKGKAQVDEDALARWRLNDKAVDIERQQTTELKKLGSMDAIDDMTIGQVRATLKGNWKHRAAILALVMSRIGLD